MMMVTWDEGGRAEAFRSVAVLYPGDAFVGNGERKHLDGVAAAFLVLALTQQAVSFHVVARHWHGVHDMEAVAGKISCDIVSVCMCECEQEYNKRGGGSGSKLFCPIKGNH